MTRTRYTSVAMTLHWAIAALILVNLVLGWRMGFLKGMAEFNMFQLHKSVGITVLLLSLGRLGWRLANPPPPEPASLKPWEKLASQAVHWGFYVIMIAMPLSGWIMVSTSDMHIPTLLFRLVPWPEFPGVAGLSHPQRQAIGTITDATHLTLAWGTLALLFLHVGAALKHQFVDRDAVLGRMVPGLRQPLSRKAR